MAEVNLSELLTAIGTAVNEAQQAIGRDAVNRYWSEYYHQSSPDDQNEAGVLAPRVKRVMLPTLSNKRQTIDVPLLTVVNHNVMVLDQVKIKLNVHASVDPETGNIKVTAAPLPRKREVDLAENEMTGDLVENIIELTFQKEVPPEGAARITQEANKFI